MLELMMAALTRSSFQPAAFNSLIRSALFMGRLYTPIHTDQGGPRLSENLKCGLCDEQAKPPHIPGAVAGVTDRWLRLKARFRRQRA